MKTRTQKEGQNKVEVSYDKKVGGIGTMVVISGSTESALKTASFLRFTGRNFRDAKIVDWSTDSECGNKSGSHRMN